MPELPEVETIKRQLLSSGIVGSTIKNIAILFPPVAEHGEEIFRSGVVGRKILEVSRYGKYLVIKLEGGQNVVLHLRMNGRLLLRKSMSPADSYTQIIFSLDDEREMRFGDSRKFARVVLMSDVELKERVVNNLGKDALDELSPDAFYQILQSSSKPIKVLLLDQQKIAGIGNIYANEALWWSGVHPETKSELIDKSESEKLLSAIQEVLTESLRRGGSSKRWFRHIDGGSGTYQEVFRVYNRAGMPCPRHESTLVTYTKLGGRGTYHCELCQIKKEYKQPKLINDQ